MKALDLFAGPGGWDEGIRGLGIESLGIEWDDNACDTRRAAGHPTLQADVAALDTADFDDTDLLLASPPCQAFSIAGKGKGREDSASKVIARVLRDLTDGYDTRGYYRPHASDERALLVVEPLRYALDLRPRRIAFEQVPPVLPLWELMAELLASVGYFTWTGKLSAEQYGVPQVRKRAVLMAGLDGPVSPPAPTHQFYNARRADTSDLPRWVSMFDAVGWGYTQRPSTTIVGASGGGPNLLDGGSGVWATAVKAYESGQFVRAPHRAGLPWNRGDLSTCPIEDGAQLQSFPRAYPWRGNVTQRALQVGNAVPPLLARAVVASLVGAEVAA